MDHAVPAAAAPAPSLVPAPTPIGRPGLSSISFLFTSRQEGDENRRHVWRPWLSSTSDSVRQAICGATGAEFTKANSEFHHPVRLFWPKSRSFDYLYRDGEILLRNFPVQATINLYEDSDSEEEEEVEEEEDEKEKVEKDQEEEKEDTDGKGPQGDVRNCADFLTELCPCYEARSREGQRPAQGQFIALPEQEHPSESNAEAQYMHRIKMKLHWKYPQWDSEFHTPLFSVV